MPCTFVNFTLFSKTTINYNKHQQNPTSHFHLFSQAFQLLSISLPKSLKTKLQFFIELFILTIVRLRNRRKNQTPNVKGFV
jgi:hypothetical protein